MKVGRSWFMVTGFLASSVILVDGADANRFTDRFPFPNRTKSFLEGGRYGSVTLSSVPDPTFDYPYLGWYDSTTVPIVPNSDISSIEPSTAAKSQGLIPYGGVKSTLSDTLQVYGNTPVFQPVKLYYRLEPNFTPKGINPNLTYAIRLDVIINEEKKYCVAKDDSGRLALYNSTALVCLSQPIIDHYQADPNGTPLAIELDLGMLEEHPKTYAFQMMLYNGEQGFNVPLYQEYYLDGRLTNLSVDGTSSTALPDNTIAHGGFLPNPDGFGFKNGFTNNPNTLTPENLAKIYGAELACLNDDAQNCIVSAYGAYQRLTEVKGGGWCYGYSVASMMIHQGMSYNGKSRPEDFNPLALNTIDLVQSDVADLIFLKFMSQNTLERERYKAENAERWESRANIISDITNGFSNGDPIASIGIFGPVRGGHSIMPYAITAEGDDIYRIYVYDNNYPDDGNKFIEINVAENTWYYEPTNWGNNDINAIPLSITAFNQIRQDTGNNTTLLSSDSCTSKQKVNMMITDPTGNVSGFDFYTGQWVNNIPGTNEIIVETESCPKYGIPITNASLNIPGMLTRAELDTVLDQSYAVYLAATVANNDIYKPSFRQESITDSYATGVAVTEVTAASEPLLFGAHPSARIITIHQTSPVTLQIFMDDRQNERGYLYSITTKEDVVSTLPDIESKFGALITDSGELEVFSFTDTEVEEVPPTMYEVTVEIRTETSTTSTTETITQPVNSALRIAPKVEPLSLPDKLDAADGSTSAPMALTLDVSRVF